MFVPAWGANSAPSNPLIGFERPIRGGGKRGEGKEGRGKGKGRKGTE